MLQKDTMCQYSECINCLTEVQKDSELYSHFNNTFVISNYDQIKF